MSIEQRVRDADECAQLAMETAEDALGRVHAIERLLGLALGEPEPSPELGRALVRHIDAARCTVVGAAALPTHGHGAVRIGRDGRVECRRCGVAYVDWYAEPCAEEER